MRGKENVELKDPRPKRRKDKQNPYTVFSRGINSKNPHYYISFENRMGADICIEVTKELFELFDQFERDDLSMMNEYDRHYEHSVLSEVSLWRRAVKCVESPEDKVEREILIHNALEILTQTQRRRLRMHYFYGLRCDEIATIEGSSIQSVSKSIKVAEKKMKKFLSEG